MKFGGVTALREVSFQVGPGEVLGVIGPNGAGKTTLIDAITGFARLNSGTVTVGHERIDGFRPARRSRSGIGRSFQQLELFEELTLYENLQVACDPGTRRRFVADLVYPRRCPLSGAASIAISEFGLENDLTRRPRELPFGRRRLVAIARAVAREPSVLLLDEPAAGLGDLEAAELGSLVRGLAQSHGMAVVLIEHNVDMVMSVCDRIIALDFGAMIAEGPPAEVRHSPALVRAYLGEDEIVGSVGGNAR